MPTMLHEPSTDMDDGSKQSHKEFMQACRASALTDTQSHQNDGLGADSSDPGGWDTEGLQTNNLLRSSLRLSMPDMDFMDFSGLDMAESSPLSSGFGLEGNMLQALLNKLPEPPISTVIAHHSSQHQLQCTERLASSFQALDNLDRQVEHKLELQTSTHSLIQPQQLSPPSSPSVIMGAEEDAEDLSMITPPAELFGGEFEVPVFETPGPSRRNTEDASTRGEVRPLKRDSGMLEAEMPPKSPFFEHISREDIEEGDRIRRRYSLTAHEKRASMFSSTWGSSAGNMEPFGSAHSQHNRASLPAIQFKRETTGRQAAAVAADKNSNDDTDSDMASDDWIGNQQPPCSPHFDNVGFDSGIGMGMDMAVHNIGGLLGSPEAILPEITVAGEAGDMEMADATVPTTAEATPRSMRSFQISVFSLLGRQQALGRQQTQAVEVKELLASEHGQPSLVEADVNDPDLKYALRRYPMVLALMRDRKPAGSNSSFAATRMRRPSPRRSGLGGLTLRLPTHSFVVTTQRQVPDREVRGMDVDRMVETYLPHLYAQSQMGQQVPTPTASPDSALAESDVVQVVPTVVHSLPAIGVEHDGGPAASKLRATASTMNMRAMFHRPPGEIAEPQLPARLGNRATPRDSIMVSRRALGRSAGWQVSRRRSEVEELISQANAVLDGSKRISGASQIRPPRSSLPVGSRWSQGSLASSRFSLPANRSSMAESLISSTPGSRTSSIRSLDPFSSDSNGLLSPADSYLTGMRSVSPASRIPSPTSGLRAPTPLLAALNRQQYRLESTRVESQVPSPLSARSVRSVRSVSHDGHLSSSSASLPHLGSSISSGLRAPSSLTTRLRESASLGQASAVSRTLISGIRPPQYSSESAVSHVRAAATSSVNSMSGLRQPSDLRKLRPVKSTSTSLRSMYTEESQRRATAEAATAAGRKPDVRTIFKPDMEFLTLRPVHTPDLVIRKFDPRMVERAMTPMLKTSVRLSAMSRGKMPNFDSDSELESESEATVSEMNSDTPVNDSTAKFSSTLPTIPGSPAVDSYRHQSDETLGVSASIEELLDAYRDDYIDSNVPSMAYLPDCDDVEVKMESRISDLGSPVLGPEKHAHRRFPTPKFLGLRRKQSQPSLIKPPSTSSVGRLSSSLIPRFSTSKQRQQQQQPSPQQQPSGIPAMRKTKSLWSLKSTWNR